ncbi:MAG: 3'(2'), 5'-bisphosphate nucleotidase [Glaciecola sp.]|jgi:3'(2'), 5'-bisphosphate nucleotidase
MLKQPLIQNIIHISHLAGDKIMDIYQNDFAIYEKSDKSPLTEADLAAHNCIVESLSKVSDFPILSEESADIFWQERSSWDTYWLVDPLDGTKEFIKKTVSSQ